MSQQAFSCSSTGPESFTLDDRYYSERLLRWLTFLLLVGLIRSGSSLVGGAGKVLAEWIVQGRPPMDLWDVDIRRTFSYQSNEEFLRERTTETLGLLYDMHWPHRQYATEGTSFLSPLHQKLFDSGAVMGEVAGFERPNWYAFAGESEYRHTYGKPNWFEACQRECELVQNSVGLFDQSSYPIFKVVGPEAMDFS